MSGTEPEYAYAVYDHYSEGLKCERALVVKVTTKLVRLASYLAGAGYSRQLRRDEAVFTEREAWARYQRRVADEIAAARTKLAKLEQQYAFATDRVSELTVSGQLAADMPIART
jgi:hypothetical protein